MLTPTGWKNIEDMTIGDEVITPKNKVEKVIGVFPQGIKDIYRVSVKDGAYLDVCENHLWKVKLPNGKFEIINTKQLNEFPPKTKSGRNQYLKIDLVDGVDFTEKEFILPPYVVGALIGDGGLSKQQCAITTKDKETVEKFKTLGMNIRHQPSMKYGYGVLGIRDEIKRLKLNVTSVDKFIPVEYKAGSYQQRLELVQGLMDTDGTVSKDGATVSFSTSSKRLAEDLQEVIRSLGGTATITTKEPFYLKDGERQYCNTSYIVYIRHRDRKSLFSLSRKRDRVVKSHPQLMSRVVSVENLGVKDYATCIAISGDEKQFISDNYMVSHNSEIGVIDFLKWTDIPNFIGVMTRRTTPQLTGPGGLLTKCKRIFSQAYEPDEYVWRAKDGKFVFHHSGAEIYLKHFENDAADVNWQGAEANLFYVDEGTQFTQHMIQYIMSRMRNPSCPEVKPHLKITCNPDADHFLRKWVEPYLLEDGTPDREKDGMVRFFTFSDGEFVWGDTKEELAERYQVTVDDVISFTYISANVRK